MRDTLAQARFNLKTLWGHLFIPRELFIRTTHGTKRIVLEKFVQIELALVAVGLLLWIAYATSGVLLGKSSNKIMQERLAETHNAYEAKISDLQKEYEELNLRLFLAKKEFTKVSDEVNKRHEHLTNLLGVQERLGKKIKRRSKKLEKHSGKSSRKGSSLKPLRSHDNVVLYSRPVGNNYGNFPARPIHLNPIQEEAGFDSASGNIKTNNKGVDALLEQITMMDKEQRAILDYMEETVERRLSKYNKAFVQTEAVRADLFAEQVQARKSVKSYVKRNGPTGGPLIRLPQPEQQVAKKPSSAYAASYNKNNYYKIKAQTEMQINTLKQKVKTLSRLDEAIIHLPLARPLASYYITSAFGPRIDPFTREWAFHTGIDLAGKDNAVQATLPGVVTFAGTARGYGKMVEITHPFGFATRFGHLDRITVKKGQKVKFKQIVGKMGNTGRSTGEHLHYEILFNDKPYDPWKFLEAGKDVFEAAHTD